MDYRMLSYPVKFLDNSECYPDENRNYATDDLCIDNSENVISTLVSTYFQTLCPLPVQYLSGDCQVTAQ